MSKKSEEEIAAIVKKMTENAILQKRDNSKAFDAAQAVRDGYHQISSILMETENLRGAGLIERMRKIMQPIMDAANDAEPPSKAFTDLVGKIPNVEQRGGYSANIEDLFKGLPKGR